MLRREEIYERVWGYAMAHGDRSVDVFVRKLRQKLRIGLAGVELHPHPLRGRLPVRARAATAAPRREQLAHGATDGADAQPALAG